MTSDKVSSIINDTLSLFVYKSDLRGMKNMPSKRFFNLSEEKRELIRKASTEEFCRVPLESVSINRIVKNAGISRGSFYTYFDDKRDLMNYLLNDIKEKEAELMRTGIKKTGGDFFKTCDLLFDLYIRYFNEEDVFRFAKSMMDQGCLNSPMTCDDKEYISGLDELSEWIWDNVDRSRISVSGLTEMKSLVLLIMMTVMVTVVGYCFLAQAGDDPEIARASYENMIKLIKNGAVKKQ